jgi:hypothetical protein
MSLLDYCTQADLGEKYEIITKSECQQEGKQKVKENVDLCRKVGSMQKRGIFLLAAFSVGTGKTVSRSSTGS